MVFTVLAGIILAGAGAFIFAFSTMLFSAIAFPVGAAMVLSGVLILLSYITSGRDRRPPDTMLVEGVVSALFGLTVLSDFVIESMISVFFGAWLTVSGANRISQSISVSRYRPRDWSKIIPLGMVCTIFGAIMMMPALTPGAPTLPMVAGAFIFDGLSLLVYAMYMKPPIPHQKELEAIQRAEAKKKAREEKVRRRNELRSLSYGERRRRIEEDNAEKRAIKAIQRAERKAKREAKKAEKFDPERTIQFTEEESRLIKDVAEETGFAMKADAAIAEEKAAEAAPAPAPEVPAEPKEEAPALYPTFNVPTDIPSLRAMNEAAAADEKPEEPPRQPEIIEPKLSAVNLEEIEAPNPEVEFEKPELPEVETLSEGGEAWRRAEILRWLDQKAEKSKEPTEEQPEYTPLTLEDLIPEQQERGTDPEDAKRFTQTLTKIDWDQIDRALGGDKD